MYIVMTILPVFNRGVSHSVMSDMKMIEQETPTSGGASGRHHDDSSSAFRSNRAIEDEFELLGGPPK